MNKSRKMQILKEFEEINKKEGKGTIITLDKEGEKGLQVPRISTNIEGLDHVLGGGLPVGRQIEIAGAKSAGKTTLAHYLTSLFDFAINHPVEGTFSWDRAKLFGNEAGQLFVNNTETGESYMNKILRFAQLGVPLQIIDSVPHLKPKKEIEKRNKAANKNTIENDKIGGVAGLINPYIPAMRKACEISGTINVWINQIRQKFNAQPFEDPFYHPAGEEHAHAMSIILRVARREWIKIENFDPRNSASREAIGIIIKVKCIKNKLSPPERECELVYLYDRGFISHGELTAAKKEITAQRKEFFKNKKNWKDTEIETESDGDEWDDIENQDSDEDWEGVE